MKFAANLFIYLSLTIGVLLSQTITTQGVLRDGTGYSVPNGTYSMTFRIYSDTTATPVWSNTRDIGVTNGIYNVILGEVQPLVNVYSDNSYWLGVEVGSDGEMVPRLKLNLSPYEFARVEGLHNIFPTTGNVGVNTTNPLSPLHVMGAAGSRTAKFETPAGTNTLDLITHNGGGNWASSIAFNDNGTDVARISSVANGQLRFFANGIEGLRIDPSGNVGIGGIDPVQRLDVYRPNANTRLRINRTDNTYESFLEFATGGTYKLLMGMDNNSDKLRFFSYGGGGTMMELDNVTGDANFNHNVGIGTSSPTYPLDVRGRTRMDYSSGYDVWIQGGESSSGDTRNLALLGDKSSDRLYLNWHGEYTGGTILGSNVGIGTTSPSEKLHVVGDAYVSSKLFVGANLYQRVDGTSQGWHKIDDDEGNSDDAHWYETTDQPSDRRLKSNITEIPNALEKLSSLHGVYFDWNENGMKKFTGFIDNEGIIAGPGASEEDNIAVQDELRTKVREKMSGRQVGVIAQEVQAVLPELVHEKEDGYLEVAYGNLVALLIEGMKEQQGQIDELKEELEKLKSSVGEK